MPRRRKHRLIAWLALSLALHLLLLWLADRAVAPPASSRAPIVLAIMHAPDKTLRPISQRPARNDGHPVTAGAAHAPANVGAVVTSAPKNGGVIIPRQTSPGPSGALALPSADRVRAIVGASGSAAFEEPVRAFGDDGLDEKTRVAQRLGAEMERIGVAQDTSTGARGAARVLRAALQARFAPKAGFVRDIPGSGAARAQIMRNLMDSQNRPQANAVMQRSMTPAQREINQGIQFADPCAASHEIGRLEARFRISHDANGQASDWKLVHSSGNEAFDADATALIRDVTMESLRAERDEATPIFSEWALSQIVYDWTSTPGCIGVDRNPGRPVFPDSRTPYAVTYVSEVHLVAVRYQHGVPKR